jgi:hypothetical protein
MTKELRKRRRGGKLFKISLSSTISMKGDMADLEAPLV